MCVRKWWLCVCVSIWYCVCKILVVCLRVWSYLCNNLYLLIKVLVCVKFDSVCVRAYYCSVCL